MITIIVDNEIYLFQNDWSISIKENQRSVFTGTLLYEEQELNFGDDIKVYDDTVCIFAGIIRELEKFGLDEAKNKLFIQVTAVDYTVLCEKRVVAEVIENMKIDEAITTYIMPILAEEGITEGVIDGDFTITRDVWRYFKVSECLDRLTALQVGFIWYIDFEKKLHFYEKNSGTIVDLTDLNYVNLSQKRSMDFYRNTQYVLSPELRTSEQPLEIMSPRADGTTRTFITRFAIAQKPSLWYTNDITAGTPTWNSISDSDIGVNGIDEGKKWYWSYNSQTVTQDDSQTVLPVNGALRITYIGLRKGIIKFENQSQISTRKGYEAGTSGIYESVVELQDVDDFYQAVNYCRSILSQYSSIADSISFETNDSRFVQGNTINFYSEYYLVYNAKFLISTINIVQDDNYNCKYTITAYDSVIIGDWEQFFFDIIKNQKKIILNVDEVLTKIHSSDESVTLDGYYWMALIQGSTIPLTIPFTLGTITTIYGTTHV